MTSQTPFQIDTHPQTALLWERLDKSIQQMLPDARLKVQPLSQCPEIKLALIDPDCLRRKFTLEEQVQIERFPAYWSHCWAAGHALAAEILRHSEWVSGKTVLDIGTGSGVVAVAAAMAGANRVIAADLDPDSLDACQLNARLNGVEIISCGDFTLLNEHIDLIFVADLLYDQNNLGLLNLFSNYANQVILAESRSPDISHKQYQWVSRLHSSTEPDVYPDQFDPFRNVNIYRWNNESPE